MTLTLQIVQLLFYVATAAVAALTFRQARRTILQPVRTETFKAQLTLLQGLSEKMPRSDVELANKINLEQICRLNAARMFSDYGRYVGTSVELPASLEFVCVHLRSLPGVDRQWKKVDSAFADHRSAEQSSNFPEPWERYAHYAVGLTREYVEYNAAVGDIVDSILLPTTVRTLLIEYMEKLQSLPEHIGDEFDHLATEMPDVYPDAVTFRKGSIHKATFSAYNQILTSPISVDILRASRSIVLEIRSLLNVNRLASHGSERKEDRNDALSIVDRSCPSIRLWMLASRSKDTQDVSNGPEDVV